MIDQTAKMLRLRVAFADSVGGGKANAQISGDEILIERGNSNPVKFLYGHEVAHWMQEVCPAEYQALKDIVSPRLVEEAQTLEALYRNNGVERTTDQAMDEAVGNEVGRLMEGGTALEEFIQRNSQNKPLLQRFLDAVRSLVGKLTGKSKQSVQTVEARLARALDSTMEAQKNTTQADGEAVGVSTAQPDAKFSLKPFAEQVADTLQNKLPPDTSVFVGNTPGFYQKAQIGLKPLPMLMTQRHIRDINHPKSPQNDHWHGLSPTKISSLPNLLEKPVMILESASRKGDIVVVTSELDGDEDPIIVSIHPDGRGQYNQVALDSNFITSMYGKQDFDGFIKKAIQQNLVLYSNKQRTQALFHKKELQLPYLLNNDGFFKERITQSEQNVKHEKSASYSLKGSENAVGVQNDSDGNTLSPAQQEYFKDSKVRDENGNLLVVYHGSTSAFNEFSHNFLGKNGRAEGSGFYFTDDKSMAKGYYQDGGQLLEGYLDIQKPLSQNEMTLTRAKVKKLIETIDPTGDELLSSYDSDGIGYPSRAWYQRSMNEALNMIIDSSDSDGEIVAEISNVIGDTKLVLDTINELYGYDGYIVDGKYEGVVYVAFHSNQFKNTDNLTPTESDDIRYSLKGSEDAKTMADLEKENQLLRERVEHWRGQLKKTDGITLQEGAVHKVARDLAKYFEADVDVEKLSHDLYELYNGIARGIHAHGINPKDGLDLDAIQKTANEIGLTLAENGMSDDTSYYEEYKDVRDYFRTQPLRISAEDRAGIADYGDFRKRNFGRMKLQTGPTNIDQVYKEMSEQRPELFDETVETNVEDQLLRISEVLDNIYRKNTVNPYGGFLDAAAVDMGNEILNRYFDIPVVKRTFADVQQGKLDKQKELNRAKIQELRAKNRESTAKIRAKDKAVYKEQMAKEIAKRKVAVEEGVLVGKFEQGKKAAQDARRAKARSDTQLDKAKAKTAEAVAKGKQAAKDAYTAGMMVQGRADAKKAQKAQERSDAEISKGKERLERHKDSQARKEMRAKIMRETQPLRQRLSRPTDKAHIPETMKKAVSDVLQAINLSSRYDVAVGSDGKEYRVTRGTGNETSLTKSFKELQQRYKKSVTDGEITQDDLLTGNGEFGGLFDEVISMGDVPILEMSQEQLQTVLDTVKILKHLIVTANQTLSNARYATISDFANRVKADTATRAAKRSLTKKHILLDMETPYTFFSHYGQAGKDIYRMLRNAQDLQTTRLNTITRLTREAVNSATVKAMEKERFEFKVVDDATITLTKAHILDLYLGMKRKQTVKHVLDGGFYQPEIPGTTIRHGDQRIQVTMEDVAAMIEKLSPEEKAIGERLQKISAGILAEWGNEASMRVFGYQKFLDKNYWAIHVSKEAINSTVERGNGQPRSTKNAGMAKPLTKNASNPVDLMSAFGNFSQQAAEMLDYSVWLAPMEDATKILNYKFKDDNGIVTGQTMKGLLNEKGGASATEYWLALMKDIQNGIGGDNDSKIGKIAAKLTGSMKGAAVGANLSVILQQPTAYLRAAYVLNPANMVKGIAKGVTEGNGWKKALKYAPIASRKAAGGFDIRSAYNVADRVFDQRKPLQKFNDAMGSGAGMMDNLTWGKLWNSCEWEISKKRPARQRQQLCQGNRPG